MIERQYTHEIARFVSGLTYDSIPPKVVHRLKLLILDSFGCALYGADLEWTRILQRQLCTIDATRTNAVWGTDLRLSAPHAALINGTQVQGFELDDVHRAGVLHVGAVVLPALIALAELRPGMSGKQFVAAAIAGYEIGPRVGLCMGPEHIAQGWHSGATLGVFAAGAAAARALGLDEERTIHALGIAGTQAAGLMAAQFGAMVKRMHAGRASQSGLYAAILAEGGFTGIRDVLENPYGGFCSTFSRSIDRFDLNKLVAGFGESWQTMGVALKFYSCVGSNHTSLDALREMQSERTFGASDIKRIVVHGSRATVDHVGWKYQPQGLTSAQLNLSYCLAAFLLEGDCFVEQFTEGNVGDPERMALAEKVEVRHDPEITARGAKYRHMIRLELELRDGTRMQRTVESPRGSEEKFASDEEILAKFDKLAARTMDSGRRSQLKDAVLHLETIPDAGYLAGMLAA